MELVASVWLLYKFHLKRVDYGNHLCASMAMFGLMR